jgi:hypothetical protein
LLRKYATHSKLHSAAKKGTIQRRSMRPRPVAQGSGRALGLNTLTVR